MDYTRHALLTSEMDFRAERIRAGVRSARLTARLRRIARGHGPDDLTA